jgi:hypothetical protein
MHDYSLTHLVDAVLLRDLVAMAAQERTGLAGMLALIAEVDARRLYAPAGYSSMHAYLVGELRFSDDAACKRIQAARVARRFPVLYTAIAEGRLHLTGVCLLAPHLTQENVRALVEAATHRRQPEIEAMLARRLLSTSKPVSDRPVVRAIPPKPPAPASEVAVPQVDWLTFERPVDREEGALGIPSGPQSPHSSPVQEAAVPPGERYLVKLTIERRVYDKLCHAQALLSHSIPSRDLAEVLDRALETLIEELEKRRFGSPRKRKPPH